MLICLLCTCVHTHSSLLCVASLTGLLCCSFILFYFFSLYNYVVVVVISVASLTSVCLLLTSGMAARLAQGH